MSLAVVIHAPRDLRLEESEVPALGPKDVEVRIAAGGICGSDLHYYQDGGFELFPVAPDHHHLRPRRREPLRHREPEPGAAAGDEGGLVG